MKFTLTIVGSLKADMEAEVRRTEQSAVAGVREGSAGLKGELRQQVVSAGFGPRLARTWRDRVYPNKGYDAAALVWSKAPQIIRAFDEGAVIRSRKGFWLAIPTPAAPKRGVGVNKRINPSNFPEHRFGKLRFVYRANGPSLLVVDAVRVNASTGRVGRQAKGGAYTKSGGVRSGVATVPMFFLVPQVRMPKRLDVARAAERWAGRVPALIVRHARQG